MQQVEKKVVGLLLLTLLATTGAVLDIREPPSIQDPAAYTLPSPIIQRGGSFKLPCVATGIPEPTYTWLCNGRELDLNTANVKRLEKGTIEISAFMKYGGHVAEYQCVASNKYGKALSQVFKILGAILEDAWNLRILTYSGRSGDPLVVPKTEIYSLPESWHVWMTVSRVGDPRPTRLQHDNRIVQDLDGNLYFTSLRASDALQHGHFYKIEVHNAVLRSALGGSYSRVAVDTRGTPTDQPPALIYPKSSKPKFNVLEGTEMKIQCIFSGYPDVNVTWWGPSKMLATPEESGTRLILREMTKEAAGEHECTGTNRVGTARSKIAVVMHTIPKFAEEGKPLGQTLTEGETATFRCQTTEDTNPQATVQWMVNGVPLQDSTHRARTEVTTIQNGKTLTIRDLNRDGDTMVVQAKVFNMHKTVYVNAPLNVLMRTKLTGKPVNQTIYSNTPQVILMCNASSDPSTPPTVMWYRAGVPITDYDDERMKQDKDAGTLTLYLDGLVGDQKAAYSGEYRCTATNGYSNDSHTAVVAYEKTAEVMKPGNGTALWVTLAFVLFGLLIMGFCFLGRKDNWCPLPLAWRQPQTI